MNDRDELKLFRDVRILIGWAAAAVPVLAALTALLWYLANHVHTFAEAQARLDRIDSAQVAHEIDHARQLREINTKLSALEPMIERRLSGLELAIERRLGPIESGRQRREGR